MPSSQNSCYLKSNLFWLNWRRFVKGNNAINLTKLQKNRDNFLIFSGFYFLLLRSNSNQRRFFALAERKFLTHKMWLFHSPFEGSIFCTLFVRPKLSANCNLPASSELIMPLTFYSAFHATSKHGKKDMAT